MSETAAPVLAGKGRLQRIEKTLEISGNTATRSRKTDVPRKNNIIT